MDGHVRLRAKEARDILAIKRDSFLRTLGMVRQMCDSAIKEASLSGRDNIEFEVPRGVMGEDGFDQAEMGKTLAQELYEDMYTVTGCAKRLKISWRDADSELVKSAPVALEKKSKPRKVTTDQIYKPFMSPQRRPLGGATGRNKKVEVSLK